MSTENQTTQGGLQPINHEAETLHEAVGLNLEEVTGKHNDLMDESGEGFSPSKYVEMLETNFTPREIASLLAIASMG